MERLYVMKNSIAAALAVVTLGAGVWAWEQRQRAVPRTPATSVPATPGNYSPLGFDDLLAYERAYPGDVGSALALQANATKYWVYQGIARRGPGPSTLGAWISLGPDTTSADAATGETVSGRVAALAVSPRCERSGPCRLWVGTAGGGVWRTDKGMHPTDPEWRWIGRGLGTNSIGSLAIDPGDRSGNTIYVGTGETNQPNNSGAGTGLYRSTDGGDRWTRIATMIADPLVSPTPIDFTSTRGIASVVVDPSNPQTVYVATASAMLGMTGVRGGQTQTTGYPQPRVGLYKSENRGQTWTLIWTPPLDPVIPPNPNIGVGVGDTMFGVRHVKLDPRNSTIVYATAWNNAIHRSAPSLENGDASFKPVFAIVGGGRFRDLAMFDLTVKSGRTRMYVYNGTESVTPQALYRLDNAEVAGVHARHRRRRGARERRRLEKAVVRRRVEPRPDEPAHLRVAVLLRSGRGRAREPARHGRHRRRRHADLRRAHDSIDGRGRELLRIRPRRAGRRATTAMWMCGPWCFIPAIRTSRGWARTAASCATTARSRISRNRCSSSFNNAAQCQTMLARVPTRLYFLNKGLQTMQFYNVAVDPAAPLTRRHRRAAGQRHGLAERRRQSARVDDAVSVRRRHVGVGLSSDAVRRRLCELSEQPVLHQLQEWRSGLVGADRRSDPGGGERESITQSTGRQFLTFDRARPDTQFTGFQHVWRTQNNGGSQALLEASCRSGAASTCGDWLPLGVAYPFAAGSTPSSPSRLPGDLTSDFYGGDRTDGLIVAAERTPADAGTLWAATNKGRLFISKNADGAAAGGRRSRASTRGRRRDASSRASSPAAPIPTWRSCPIRASTR